MVNEAMRKLGAQGNPMRVLFEYGKKRAAVIGAENVLDFALGNPSVPPPARVNEVIREVLDGPRADSIHAYTSAAGDLDVRRTLAKSLNRRFDAACRAEDLFLTAGAAPALCACLKGLCCPGDQFIVIAPYFTEYRVFVEGAGGEVLEVMAEKDTFLLDIPAIEAALNPRVKGVVINSPNNPSGVVYPSENLIALGDLLRRKSAFFDHPIYLISDEPYREVVYDGVQVPWVPHYYENTLVCYSYSKAISLPGERIGYVLVPPAMDDHDVVYQAVAGAGRCTGHINAPALFQQVAAACDGMVSDLTAYTTNRNLLYENLTAMGFECVKPNGTFYLLMKSPEPDAAAFSRRAMELDLLFPDTGSFAYPGYVRIAYCVPTRRVEMSLPRFRKLAEMYGLTPAENG
ncbi:MAG: pyridoxal phosphate-dependent aminotransferase [Oscillospiraceae bacterium]|nr:pyridoxal phosphate-dependent aminotransferase [Oscillospiraceae bacterium]